MNATGDEKPHPADEGPGAQPALRALGEWTGREFSLSYSPGTLTTWLLCGSGDRFGVLEMAAATVRGANDQWRVGTKRRRAGRRLVFSSSLQTNAVASYYPRHWLPGGTLKLSEEQWYTLLPTWPLRQPWEIRDQRAAVFAQVRQRSRIEWLVDLSPDSASEPSALLVTLAMSYVILLDRTQPVPAG